MAGAWTRRRFLAVSAAAIAASRVTAATPVAMWRGPALGTLAEVRLVGVDDPDPVFARVEAELARIDRLFSLYRSDSALVRLNRDGWLEAPDPAILELLSLSRAMHHATEGAFDPTVQPLFALHASCAAEGRVPAVEEIEAARALVSFDQVTFDMTTVRLARPGVALTLNGIAQGYATDQLAALLRDEGLRDVMVDAGEVAGIGNGPEGKGWRVRLPGSDIRLRGQAVATSSATGTLVDPALGTGHIFDPLDRRRPSTATISVIHDSAAIADALSTAAIVMPGHQLRSFEALGAKVIRFG
ncbi:FAD:protein FMN transferase [Maritimibacter sp. DP1N21-5]|uniref:FAD:protein FMN transferase n=1 Tax=Maritimibacter sp. DP1N21-5 TaxID=2836867 RepID=UPI001C48D298|nr:FAD:protein FMN transferase [Maritimibacter sp. DP1N21-5]MBV7410073.1 FAD:protein FMN transferase [Maritimibacter sp. DP1N21-5]